MTMRGIAWAVVLSLAGVASAGVTIYGVASAIGIDLRQNPVLSVLYCGLPLLCFPVFALMRPVHRSAPVLALMAVAYLGVYSALNWRTCSELGYCEDVLPVVAQTLSTNMVLAFFSVVILSLIAVLMDHRSSVWRDKGYR
jgi:hypothetical protein